MAYTNFKVYCPAQKGRVEPMAIYFVGDLPLPCAGCHNANGSMVCQRCVAAITDMFYKNPELSVLNPLKVDLETLP